MQIAPARYSRGRIEFFPGGDDILSSCTLQHFTSSKSGLDIELGSGRKWRAWGPWQRTERSVSLQNVFE